MQNYAFIVTTSIIEILWARAESFVKNICAAAIMRISCRSEKNSVSGQKLRS